MKFKLYLSIAVFSLLSLNVVAGDARFGGPEQVDNRIAEDKADRDLPLKEKLAAEGIDLAIDYTAVGFNLSDTVGAADDNSAGGMVRLYGSWKATDNGSLIWKIEHRHSYTDTAPVSILFNVLLS